MPWRADRTLLAVLGLAAAACGGAADENPAPDVFVDGIFDEWSGVAALIDDPADAPDAAVDLGAIHVLSDDAWLYLSLEVGREVNAQSLPGSMIVLLDADANASSGARVHDVAGVDLVLEISHVADPLRGARGIGLALRPVGRDGPADAVGSYPLGVVVAPTWSATRFEMRVSRTGSSSPPLPQIGDRVRIAMAYVERGELLDRTALAEYEAPRAATSASGLDGRAVTAAATATTSAEARLVRPTRSTRVAQMNVSGRSFDRRPGDFARALAAVEPDVILLDELSGDVQEAALRDFFDSEPLRGLGSWSFVLGASGGRQRAAVATRTGEVRAANALRDVRYADGAVEALKADLPSSYHAVLDREQRGGLSATGGWVTVDGRDVLFAAMDLQSQGFIGSPFDRLRTLQAETLRNRIVRALDTHEGSSEPPVVIGGDLNLVGSRAPLRALTEGLGADGLRPVRAERLGERTLSTWRSVGAPFAPGRLDFILAPAADVAVENAFVFTTEDLGPELLERLGLEAGLSEELSDHLIVVADLRMR